MFTLFETISLVLSAICITLTICYEYFEVNSRILYKTTRKRAEKYKAKAKQLEKEIETYKLTNPQA